MTVPVLHVLTSDDILARQDFPDKAAAVLRAIGPRGALHLRTRMLDGRHFLTLARQLAASAEQSGATLVVSGRVDVALVAGTAAVQLGRTALPLGAVSDILSRVVPRARAPRLRIGVSVHDLDDARALATAPTRPDWVIFGHVFETGTHPGDPARGLDALRAIVAAQPSPVIAVGGITVERVAAVRAAGARGVATISGVWGAAQPEEAAIRYLSAYGE